MLKALFALIIILTATPAEAGPALMGIAAFGVKLFTAFGGVLFKAAMMVGSSLVQQYLARRAQKKSQVSGVTLELKMGDDVPLTFPVGERAVAGRRKYAGTHGDDGNTPNAFAVDVIELSSLPSFAGSQGIETLWIDDKKCKVNWDRPHIERGYPVEEFRKDGKDNVWIWYLDGTQTTANRYLRSKFANHVDRPFLDDMIGRGCQVIIVTTRLNRDLQLGGSLPAVLVEPKPTRFYDLREDSTNGGNGLQRYTDPSTWKPTRNPAIISYNIIRGIYYGTEWLYGGQNVPAFRLPSSAWIAAANECDRLVPGPDGNEPQFRCGYEIYVDVEPLEVLEELRLACLGRFVETGGMVKLLVGSPGSAVYFIDDDSLVISREQDLDPFPSISEINNHISATYPERGERWTMKDAPERRNPDLEREDGDRSLPLPIAFEAVPFAGQVQRSTKTLVEEGRRFRTHIIPLPPSAWVLEPSVDVISWSSARNGYQNKKWLITQLIGFPGMVQQAAIRELDPSDYTPPSVVLPPVLGTIGPIARPPHPMYGWSVVDDVMPDELGRLRRPTVRFSCAPDQDGVTHVHVQLRVRDVGSMVFDSDSTPYGKPYSWTLALNLPGNTWFQGRGRFKKGAIYGEWSEWFDVKTRDIKLGPLDIYDISLTQLDATIKQRLKWLDDGQRDIWDEMERTAQVATEQNSNSFQMVQQLRTKVNTAMGKSRADYENLVTVVAENNAASVSRLETLRAEMDDNFSSFDTLYRAKIEVIEGSITAQSDLIQSLTSQVNDVKANVTVRAVTMASPGGGIARWGVQAATGSTDSWTPAVFYIEADGSDTSAVFEVDKFIVRSGNAKFSPITVINGKLTGRFAAFEKVTAGILGSDDDMVEFNLSQKKLIFRDNS